MQNAKILFLFLTVLISVVTAAGQGSSSHVEIITVYSQNEKFYLKSIPFDNEHPSLRGKTFVYAKGDATPLYVFERGFDDVSEFRKNILILSNNGEVIFYAIVWGADEKREGLKSVTIYRKGNVVKSYTEAEITGCDEEEEHCRLFYLNNDKVIDREKSGWFEGSFRRVFKPGVDEKERFLNDFPIFSFNDTVYLTDSKKKTHLFDLNAAALIRSESFENIFAELKDKARFNRIETKSFKAPVFLDFPKLKNGKDTTQDLAAFIGMKPARSTDDQYKIYSFRISGFLSQDGSYEVENIELYEGLPKEKIVEFFQTNKFDAGLIPKDFEKWHLNKEYFYFRNKDDRAARREKAQEKAEYRKELAKRMTLEKINGIYIPKNLEECFTELDKLLKEVDKKEMQALSKREEMIRYHHGLGTALRNNWGLWSGSPLLKYFTDKGIRHPDEMSSVILYYYYDWLNGQKESWKEWEINPKLKY